MFEFKNWNFFFFISGRQQSRHLLHQPTSVRQRSTFRHRLSNRFTDSGQKVGLWTTKRSRNRYRRQGWWRSPSRDQVTVFLNTVTTRILNARLPDFYYFDIWIIKNSENVWKCPKQPFTVQCSMSNVQMAIWLLVQNLDKFAHVQVVINCRYFIAQMSTRKDMLAHI